MLVFGFNVVLSNSVLNKYFISFSLIAVYFLPANQRWPSAISHGNHNFLPLSPWQWPAGPGSTQTGSAQTGCSDAGNGAAPGADGKQTGEDGEPAADCKWPSLVHLYGFLYKAAWAHCAPLGISTRIESLDYIEVRKKNFVVKLLFY